MTDMSTLQWMGPELARAGLVRNDAWVEVNCHRAVGMFANQGLHIAATLMAALHPRAVDYIEQAPVLVLAASQGAMLHRQAERRYLAERFGSICHRGPKLKEVLAEYGLVPQHRALQGHALTPTRWSVVKRLKTIPASTLAQSIPATRQAAWLRDLSFWSEHIGRRYGDADRLFEWAALAMGRDESVRHSVSEVADFAGMRGAVFDQRWTWEQANAASERWHVEFAKMSGEQAFFAKHGIGFSDTIDYGPMKTNTEINGYEIAAVQSGESLYAEGLAMHHCVSSYTQAVLTGKARIYSIRKNGKRVATAELVPHTTMLWRLAQLKGPCNRPVTSGVWEAATKFAAKPFQPNAAVDQTSL